MYDGGALIIDGTIARTVLCFAADRSFFYDTPAVAATSYIRDAKSDALKKAVYVRFFAMYR